MVTVEVHPLLSFIMDQAKKIKNDVTVHQLMLRLHESSGEEPRLLMEIDEQTAEITASVTYAYMLDGKREERVVVLPEAIACGIQYERRRDRMIILLRDANRQSGMDGRVR